MRVIVYTLLAALVLVVLKAFYLDEYLAKRKAAEANATETNVTIMEMPKEPFTKPVPVLKTRGIYSGEQNLTVEKRKPSYSEMPLEKVGNTIAEKIGGKL
jgi:hypothetical protein